MTLKLRPEVKALWIDALTGDEYKQARAFLRRGSPNRPEPAPTDGMCCLGVLCDLYAKHNPGKGEWAYYPGVNGNLEFITYPEPCNTKYSASFIPKEVHEWATGKTFFNDDDDAPTLNAQKFSVRPNDNENAVMLTLPAMNDQGMSFKFIAEVIKEKL